MLGLLAQIEAFFSTLILGIVLGIFLHYYQLTIRKLRVGKYSLYLLDFCLWIIMILVIAAAMLLINQGEMRAYVLIALLCGIAIYYSLVAKYLIKPLSSAAQATADLLRGFFTGLRRLFGAGFRWIKAFNKKAEPPLPPDQEA